MAEIEATCARLAAMSMTPIERRRLQHLQDAMAAIVRRDDRDAYAVANVGFHTRSISARTTRSSPISRPPAAAAGAVPARAVPHRRTPARSHAEHAAVVKAILACDAAAAHAAMFHHMSLVEDSFGQLGAASRASA